MIRMIQSTNSGHAKSYFNDALSRGDYYMDGQELSGRFHGKAAEKLGLSGAIEKSDFYRLCENINPKTGEKLTPRNKSNRTVGYDINFHCPKSVSILNALGDDKRVMEAFRASVNETMIEIEKDIKTRVRGDRAMDERTTRNLIWGEFVHLTARPVDGMPPDPHLHAHCFVLNTTWDEAESKFKAGQFRDIKRDMPYYQSMFQKTMADKLNAIGYETQSTEKAFEITAIPQKAIEVFSKRTDTIGRYAKEKGISDIYELDKLGARTRSKKEKGYSMTELRELWIDQVKDIKDERITGSDGKTTTTQSMKEKRISAPEKALTAEQCVDYALNHCFERYSVVQDRVLLSTAMQYGIRDCTVKTSDIKTAFENDKRIIRIEYRNTVQCTTKEVHFEEKKMIDLARKGKGIYRPIDREADKIEFHGLNNRQSRAVRQVLGGIDRVTIIQGKAGTGKTSLMREAVENIEKSGLKVFPFAPSSEAAKDVLRGEGFGNADTVARLLLDRELQSNIKGQVLWIDEAGLLSTKDMVGVLRIADENNARVVLSGDTRQHSSVQRGDALRILRNVGGIKVAGVNQIYRQKVEAYKNAVSDISEGKVASGFDRLDKMGAIVEKEPYELTSELAKDYLDCRESGKSALIIAPTHEQGEAVSDKIREELRNRKIIGEKDRPFERLKNKNLTEAQKQDVRNFKAGEAVQFHQNVKGIQRGSKLAVKDVSNDTVILADRDGKTIPLPLNKPECFDVYTVHELNLTQGDAVRITKNGFDKEGTRLDNGKVLEVKGFDRSGNIKAISANNPGGKEIILDKDFGNINHAYVMTSHASQGKTFDRVFIAQPSATFPATNTKQFYVSVSRGRESVKIYTDSKEDLLDHVQVSGDRLSATELQQMQTDKIADMVRVQKTKESFKEHNTDTLKPKDYGREPEI